MVMPFEGERRLPIKIGLDNPALSATFMKRFFRGGRVSRGE